MFPNADGEIKNIKIDLEKTAGDLSIQDIGLLCDYYASKAVAQPELLNYDHRGQNTTSKYADYI